MSLPHRNNQNPNLRQQAQQSVGDDVIVLPLQTSGDVVHWGNYTFEGLDPAGVQRAVNTTYPVTELENDSLITYDDANAHLTGHAVSLHNVQPLAYGSNQPWATGGESTIINRLGSATVGTRGDIYIPKDGTYKMRYMGRIQASGGSITTMLALFRRVRGGVVTYLSSGCIMIAGVNLSACPYSAEYIFGALEGDVWAPAVNLSVSAGTAVLNQLFWHVTPLV